MDENKTNSEPDDSVQLPPTQHDELKAEYHQPAQVFSPTSGSSQVDEPERPAKKSSNWRSFIYFLLIITTGYLAAGYVLFLLAMMWQDKEAGASGSGYSGLFDFMIVVQVVIIAALGTIIGTRLYLRKPKVSRWWRVFSIVSQLLAFVLLLYFLFLAIYISITI